MVGMGVGLELGGLEAGHLGGVAVLRPHAGAVGGVEARQGHEVVRAEAQAGDAGEDDDAPDVRRLV